MSSNAGAPGLPTREAIGVGSVIRIAWPAAISYLLSNAYRINDQYWIQGLGAQAQAAISGTVFVVIMNFSVVFLAAGGTLALVARASGARDREMRDALITSALLLATSIWAVLALVGPWATPHIVDFLGLEQGAVVYANAYLSTLYLCCLPLVLAPALDHVLIGMGNTLAMSLMELCALLLHFLLSPILIYGPDAAQLGDHPGAQVASAIASALGIEGHGIAGAAWSAAIARGFTVLLGLVALRRWYGVRLFAGFAYARRLGGRVLLVPAILRISFPTSLAIATYASVYWALIKWVVVPLGSDALAALGIGFAVFEGVSFPLYLGVAMAGASLVGRALGAGDSASALQAVASVRKLALGLGGVATLVFLTCAERFAPAFSADAAVQREVAGYVFVLGFSQIFVALEAANEKVLLGAGYTRPALWVSLIGNGIRVPLAWFLSTRMGLGVHGVWWALSLTSALKAGLQFALVERRCWLVPQRTIAVAATN